MIASGDALGPGAIAIDDTHVYWANFESANISVMKTPLDGGTVTVLASGLDRVRDIAVYGGQVYFVINSASVQSVARVGSGGGPVATLSANHATCISVDSTVCSHRWSGTVSKQCRPTTSSTVRADGAGRRRFFSDSIALGTKQRLLVLGARRHRSTAKAP